MSTRIEKGNQRFKPITRNKPILTRAKQPDSRTRTPIDSQPDLSVAPESIRSESELPSVLATPHVIPSLPVQSTTRESVAETTRAVSSTAHPQSYVSERQHSPVDSPVITSGGDNQRASPSNLNSSISATRSKKVVSRPSKPLAPTLRSQSSRTQSPISVATRRSRLISASSRGSERPASDDEGSAPSDGAGEGRDRAGIDRSLSTLQTAGATTSNHEGVGSTDEGEMHAPSTSRKRKRTGSSKTVIDNSIDAGDPLDPTATAIKDLCGAVGIGRVSSRHIEVQLAHIEAKKLERDRRARIALVREARDKRGEDLDDPDIPLRDPQVSTQITSQESMPIENQPMGAGEGGDYAGDLRANYFTVTMRMDASGQMIVDEDSLIVDRAANPDIVMQADSMVHVEETDGSRFINSATHSRKSRGSRWSKEETAQFYYALRQFNTDFTMISLVMPGRSARECRNKFNNEDRKNKGLIDWALTNTVPIDMDMLSRMTGKTFAETPAEDSEQHMLGPTTQEDIVPASTWTLQQVVQGGDSESAHLKTIENGGKGSRRAEILLNSMEVLKPVDEVEILGDVDDGRWQNDDD